ncbi:MAG: PfkB family carbohydrate kinase [Treponema sp.]|nr:PfkB family carbohydrate kinase [Treponema sp.]
MKILCICLSSTIQRTIHFENLMLSKVNRSRNYRQDASGKAVNSARVLNQLEKNCTITLCPLGEKNLELFVTLAQKDGLTLKTLSIPGFTRECWTLLDNSANTTTELVVSEPVLSLQNNNLTKKEKEMLKNVNEKFLELVKQNICDVDAVLLAGSRPDFWDKNLYADICFIAKQNEKFFLADFIGDDLKNVIEKAVPSVIKINDEEFFQTFSKSTSLSQNQITDLEFKELICQKSAELNNMIIVTRGTKSTYAANKGIFFECPTEKVYAVNTTACGDSFNAGFLYEYLKTNDFESSLKKGTWCAARNAERDCPGTILNI